MEAMRLAKRHKHKKPARGPGYNSQRELQDVPVGMERPYEVGGTRHHDEKPQINVRETPLDHMYARGVISDGEWRAGVRVRACCETLWQGGLVIDLEAVRAACSGPVEATNERKAQAASDLRDAVDKIGHMDFCLLVDTCGVGYSLVEVAKRWYHGLDRSPRQAKEAGIHIGRRVRDALAVLAKHWRTDGGAGRAQGTQALRGFDKASLDPSEWNYSPQQAKADNKARRRRRRRKH